MSRVKDAERVHFTHHGCLASGVTTLRGEKRPASWSGIYHREPITYYPSAFEKVGFQPHGRTPCDGCSRARRKGDAGRFTTNTAEVTCEPCLREIADGSKEAWERKLEACRPTQWNDDNASYYKNWRSNKELTIWCWLACCRHHGTPWPYTEHEQLRAERVSRSIQIRKGVSMELTVRLLDVKPTLEALFRERVGDFAAPDRALMEPLLLDARVVDELLSAASQKLHAMKARADEVSSHVLSGALVLPDLQEAN